MNGVVFYERSRSQNGGVAKFMTLLKLFVERLLWRTISASFFQLFYLLFSHNGEYRVSLSRCPISSIFLLIFAFFVHFPMDSSVHSSYAPSILFRSCLLRGHVNRKGYISTIIHRNFGTQSTAVIGRPGKKNSSSILAGPDPVYRSSTTAFSTLVAATRTLRGAKRPFSVGPTTINCAAPKWPARDDANDYCTGERVRGSRTSYNKAVTQLSGVRRSHNEGRPYPAHTWYTRSHNDDRYYYYRRHHRYKSDGLVGRRAIARWLGLSLTSLIRLLCVQVITRRAAARNEHPAPPRPCSLWRFINCESSLRSWNKTVIKSNSNTKNGKTRVISNVLSFWIKILPYECKQRGVCERARSVSIAYH